MKIVLAYLVAIRHCAQNYLSSEKLFYQVIVNWLSVLAVPTFFAVSSFLLYARNGDVKKQLWRIIRLYMVWTVLYLPINAWGVIKSDNAMLALARFIQETVMSGSYYHLWFIPALVVGFAVFSLLKRLCNNKNGLLSICFLLFMVGIFGDSWRKLICNTPVDSLYKLYEVVFITTRNGIFFAPVFICIGYLTAEYKGKIKDSSVLCLMVASALIAVVEIYCTRDNSVNNMMLYPVFMVPVVLAKATEKIGEGAYLAMRRMSTLVFCGHPWAICLISHLPVNIDSGAVKSILVIFLTFALSFIIEKLSMRFNKLKLLY